MHEDMRFMSELEMMDMELIGMAISAVIGLYI